MRLLALLGRGFLLLATMAFLTGISLFVIGAYLITWPMMRISPRAQRVQAISDVAVALLGLACAYENSRPSSPNSAPCAGAPEGG